MNVSNEDGSSNSGLSVTSRGIPSVRKKKGGGKRARTRMRESKLTRHEIDIAFMATRYFLPRVQFAKRAVAYNKKSDTARTSGCAYAINQQVTRMSRVATV